MGARPLLMPVWGAKSDARGGEKDLTLFTHKWIHSTTALLIFQGLPTKRIFFSSTLGLLEPVFPNNKEPAQVSNRFVC